jgi:hypothetical protein
MQRLASAFPGGFCRNIWILERKKHKSQLDTVTSFNSAKRWGSGHNKNRGKRDFLWILIKNVKYPFNHFYKWFLTSVFIPDPESEFFHPGSRIRIKEFEYFDPKNCFQDLRNMIQDVHPGSGSWFITHPGSGSATMVLTVDNLGLIFSGASGFSESVFGLRSSSSYTKTSQF